MMETYQILNQLQRDYMDRDHHNEKRKVIHDSWLDEETVDYWRHSKMYQTIAPVAAHNKEAKWLSIGDGRYGLDAYRLNKIFNIDIFPTDISKSMISRGKDLGFISRYGVENAEELSFHDSAFDIVFCKESFHHFPRPMIALYEMIRVSKHAVILIEPNDYHVLKHPISFAKSLVKWLLSHLFWNDRYKNYNFSLFSCKPSSFEKSGNFVYTLSKIELEKITHALNLKEFAWKGHNDYYTKGCEFERAEPYNKVFTQTKKNIKKMDKRCRWLPLFFDYNLITAVIFKTEIDKELKKEMQSFGYKFSEIKPNPYI